MWFFFLFVSGILAVSSSGAHNAVNMTIKPTGAIREPGTSITAMCNSDRPLSGCNFRVWYVDTAGTGQINKDYTVMEFSNGPQSANITTSKHGSIGADLYHAAYTGRGLSAKECGVLFTPLSQGRYLVGCRGRAEPGAWGYAFMPLDVKYSTMNIDRNDPGREIETLAKPTKDARIVHNVTTGHVLRGCIFFLQTSREVVAVTQTSIAKKDGTYETSRDDSQCKLTLKKVTERNNGLLWYSVTNSIGRRYETDLYYKIIVIEKAPSVDNISLQLAERERPYTDGAELMATCTVTGSRPVASITWLLKGKTLRKNAVDDADRAWRWPWDEASITQTLHYHLSAADNGSVLTCRVQHPALERYLEKNISLVVAGVPKPTDLPVAQGTEASSNEPTHTQGDHIYTSQGPVLNTPKSSAPVPENTSHPSSSSTVDDLSPTGRGVPDDDAWLFTVIASSCVVLVLALLGAVVYAKVARKCCFRQEVAVSNTAYEGERSSAPSPWVQKPSGKPRAPSPERVTSRMEQKTLDREEGVAYAEIVGVNAADTRAMKSMPDDTTYAELSFR